MRTIFSLLEHHAEIPYITQHMTNGRSNPLSQMEELVIQNYNYACIAAWGLSNEITAASAVKEELLENHWALNELCHRPDSTCPTTLANVLTMLDMIEAYSNQNEVSLYVDGKLVETKAGKTVFKYSTPRSLNGAYLLLPHSGQTCRSIPYKCFSIYSKLMPFRAVIL